MDSRPSRRVVTARIVRQGEPASLELDDSGGMTPGERIESVWELTRLCLAWQGLAWQGEDEPRLQRSVVRIQRARR